MHQPDFDFEFEYAVQLAGFVPTDDNSEQTPRQHLEPSSIRKWMGLHNL